MKYLITLFVLTLSTNILAGQFSDWATPTQIDIERGNGFMVYGAYGNANDCTIAGRFYVKKDHPQYDKIYSAVLSAHASNKKIRAYISSCEPVTWYAVLATTFNTLSALGSLEIKN